MKKIRKLILLVEDDLFIRELYQHVLEKAGYTVIAAENGEEGIRMSEAQPDLILLDIMLPKMHGIDVLVKIKQNKLTEHIPVVLLTNLGEESIIAQAFRNGAEGYVMKSKIIPKELVKIVAEHVSDMDMKKQSSL